MKTTRQNIFWSLTVKERGDLASGEEYWFEQLLVLFVSFLYWHLFKVKEP